MLGRLMSMAWRNLRRNLRRTLITTVALGGGLALSMAGWVLMDGMLQTMVDSMVAGSTGHIQVLPPGQLEEPNVFDTLENTDAIVAQIEADPRVLGVAPRIHGAGLLAAGERSTGAEIIGVDPKREGHLSQVLEHLSEGRFVSKTGEVALGVALAAELRVGLSDEVMVITQATDGSIGNALWTVVGLLKTGSDATDRSSAWITLEEAEALMVLQGAHIITLRLHDPDSTDALLAELASQPGWTGVFADRPPEDKEQAKEVKEPGLTPVDPEGKVVVRSWRAANPVMAGYYEMSSAWTLIMALIILATAGLGTMNTLLMSVLERTRELGIMRAVGLKPSHMILLILFESMWIGVISCLVGGAVGYGLCDYLVRHGIDLSEGYGDMVFAGLTMKPVFFGAWSTSAWLLPLVSLLIISVLASLLPAWRAARLNPVDAMGRR